MISKLVEEKKFADIDYLGAIYALKGEGGVELNLIATLLLSTRLGHLSLIAEKKALKHLFQTEEIPLTPLEEKELIASILEGAKSFKSHDLIVKEGNEFTLKRYFEKRKNVHERLKNLSAPRELYKPIEMANLLPQQAKAIQWAAKHPLTIIAGGPGTGKTFTAGLLVKTLLELSNHTLKVSLAAPTGKAAINLQKSFGGEIEATTLHSLLNYKRDKKVLTSDVLVVDECSMIDLSLMNALLSSLKPNSRLILLGDPYQLPPVEVGNVFPEIINSCAESVITLEQCMRTDIQEILLLANAVKKEQHHEIDALLKGEKKSITYNSTIEFEACLKQSLGWLTINTPQEALAQLKKSSILSPLRKGPFGFEELNRAIYAELKQLRRNVPIPIMITKNDRKLNLFNGQMGVLFHDGLAVFEDFGPSLVRTLNSSLLPPYEKAFCLSVHKSQGSEFECVTLLLPAGYEVFGKELVYTGITRAKRHLNLFGNLKY